jgi:hypothetical protein
VYTTCYVRLLELVSIWNGWIVSCFIYIEHTVAFNISYLSVVSNSDATIVCSTSLVLVLADLLGS